jgi:hypothetical protein
MWPHAGPEDRHEGGPYGAGMVLPSRGRESYGIRENTGSQGPRITRIRYLWEGATGSE